MSKQRTALLLLKGMIAEYTEEDQRSIEAAKLDILATMEKHEEAAAILAVSVVGVELAIKHGL